jgi:carbonic anhydrase
MAKYHQESVAKDQLAPISLISSLLVGFPFLCLLTLLDVTAHPPRFTSALTFSAMLLFGLSLSFFWRRIDHAASKNFLAISYISIQWFFMVGVTVVKILDPHSPNPPIESLISNGSLIATSLIATAMIIIWALTHSFAWQPTVISMAIAGSVLAGILTFTTFRADSFPYKKIKDAVKSSVAHSVLPKPPAEGAVVHGGEKSQETIIKADETAAAANPHGAVSLAAAAPIDKHQDSENKQETAATPELAAASAEEKAPAGSTPHEVARESSHHEGGQKAHWGYEGQNGPEFWAGMNSEYAACGKGIKQSPIDIDREAATIDAPEISYGKTTLKIVDNGHTIQLPQEGKGSKIVFRNTSYFLKQIHFHAPSEHTVNGIVYPMEIHLVHASRDNKLAVLGVLVERGNENSEIAKVWPEIPGRKNEEEVLKDIQINLKKLVPSRRQVYHYSGSLTTPPCTEGVKWFVYKNPIGFSEDQLKNFKQIYSNNARPTQPLNKRIMNQSDD